jgi:hypothetical protein
LHVDCDSRVVFLLVLEAECLVLTGNPVRTQPVLQVFGFVNLQQVLEYDIEQANVYTKREFGIPAEINALSQTLVV